MDEFELNIKSSVEFYSTDKIIQYKSIAIDFLKQIFNLNYDECFISDQTSLYDFSRNLTTQELNKKILEIYKVDISNIVDGNLVSIFEKINARDHNINNRHAHSPN